LLDCTVYKIFSFSTSFFFWHSKLLKISEKKSLYNIQCTM
jgi:hypothetical protein